MNSFTKLIQQIKSANYSQANQTFADIMQQKVADRLAVERQTIFREEAEMTDAQMKKREEIVKSMKDKEQDFKDRYGDRWKEVMYATATKMATES
jgi:DNA-binding XRE family transcriptional regulator